MYCENSSYLLPETCVLYRVCGKQDTSLNTSSLKELYHKQGSPFKSSKQEAKLTSLECLLGRENQTNKKTKKVQALISPRPP